MSGASEMRVCKYCGFFFEGPAHRLTACCNCDARNEGRQMFSAAVSNAQPDVLIAAIPHLITALQALRLQVASMAKGQR